MTRLRLLGVCLLLLILTLVGEEGAYQSFQLKRMKNKLTRDNRELTLENSKLVQEIYRLKEPEYIERLIREEWGFIREGEHLVEMPDSP
jgi:cell division protein FtsB